LNRIDVTNTYYRYDAIYQQRRVLGLKLPTALNGYLEWDATVPNLQVRTIGTAIGVGHEFGRIREFGREGRLTGSFAIEDITRDEFGQPETKSRSHILGSSVSRDTRDFVLNPSVGEYRVLTGDVAGGILGGDNDFYTFTGNYQRYHGVRRTWVLAWRASAGYAEAYGRSAEVPVENRYFLGGSNSVRGYEESGLGPRTADGNVAGGEFMVLANVELRYPLPFLGRWNFSGAFFVDSGNVWAGIDEVAGTDFDLTSGVDETDVNDYRYGVGLGIRYNTPVGPIRVDFGYPLKPDRYMQEAGNDRGTWYLSLGQIF
jgi:outer membrane protein assembly factor BamA